jgi:hypothetical protein
MDQTKEIEEKERLEKMNKLGREIEKGIAIVVGKSTFIIRCKMGKFDPYLPILEQTEIVCTHKDLSDAIPEQIDNLIEFCKKWKEIIEVFKPKEEEK